MAPLRPCRGQKHDVHPIGTKIHKTFDGVEHIGEVTEFTTSSGFYKIVHEDDDSEAILLIRGNTFFGTLTNCSKPLTFEMVSYKK